jgi:hypothetical protein
VDSSPAIAAPAPHLLCKPRGSDALLYERHDPALLQHALPSLAVRMAQLFDGSRALAAVCDDLGISLSKGQAVADKLCALGVLRRMPGRATPTPADEDSFPMFSPAEEAFFAAELHTIDECNEPFPSWRELVRRRLAALGRWLRR